MSHCFLFRLVDHLFARQPLISLSEQGFNTKAEVQH